jgi:hypothetical protein
MKEITFSLFSYVEKLKTMASDYASLERNAKKKLPEAVERVKKSAPKEIYQNEHCRPSGNPNNVVSRRSRKSHAGFGKYFVTKRNPIR